MSRLNNFSDEELKRIVANSHSYHDVAKALGYKAMSGELCNTIKHRIEQLGISTEHYTFHRRNANITEKDVFCKNSTVSQHTLRNYFFKGNYQQYECSICGLQSIWNGMPLTLTLDHINGDNTDNRLQNLRWVCPNCDRQLPTFGAKNIKPKTRTYRRQQETKCVCCGKVILKNATYCVDCLKITQRKAKRPSKEELLTLIQETSFLQIAKTYGVTDNAVRKWCKYYGLPYRKKDIENLATE